MKLLLTCILLLLSLSGYSQIELYQAGESIRKEAALFMKELKLPTRKEAGKKELLGKYMFALEADGSLSNIKVKDSVGFGIDEQIMERLSQLRIEVLEIDGKPVQIGSITLPFYMPLRKK